TVVVSIRLRHAAVVEDDLVWRRGDLNSRDGFGRAANFQPFLLFSLLRSYPHRHLGSGGAAIFDRDSHHVTSGERRPRICRFDAEIGETAVAIDPIVEKPFQVAL